MSDCLHRLAVEIFEDHKKPGRREAALLVDVSDEVLSEIAPDLIRADIGDRVIAVLNDLDDVVVRELANRLPPLNNVVINNIGGNTPRIEGIKYLSPRDYIDLYGKHNGEEILAAEFGRIVEESLATDDTSRPSLWSNGAVSAMN